MVICFTQGGYFRQVEARFDCNYTNLYEAKAGDEYKVTVIKNVVRKLGDYEKFVKIKAFDFNLERGCTYTISEDLSSDTRKQIKDAIEKEGLRLTIKIAEI